MIVCFVCLVTKSLHFSGMVVIWHLKVEGCFLLPVGFQLVSDDVGTVHPSLLVMGRVAMHVAW